MVYSRPVNPATINQFFRKAMPLKPMGEADLATKTCCLDSPAFAGPSQKPSTYPATAFGLDGVAAKAQFLRLLRK
jgi:hypothetical protein